MSLLDCFSLSLRCLKYVGLWHEFKDKPTYAEKMRFFLITSLSASYFLSQVINLYQVSSYNLYLGCHFICLDFMVLLPLYGLHGITDVRRS